MTRFDLVNFVPLYWAAGIAAVFAVAAGFAVWPVGTVTMDELAARWKATWERDKGKPPRLLTPLPRRVRLHLWLTRQVNAAGIWLVEHGHLTAAERLWRVCRRW